MGTLISGWVEIKAFAHSTAWDAVIDIVPLVEVNYAMFGSLFGIRSYGHFRPIAAHRGMPADASEQVRREAEDENPEHVGHTWVLWSELAAIDWEEANENPTSRATHSIRADDGAVYLYSKPYVYKRDAEGRWALHQNEETDGPFPGERFFVPEVTKRGDTRVPGWDLLFGLMERLAAVYGADNVRLVVWFS